MKRLLIIMATLAIASASSAQSKNTLSKIDSTTVEQFASSINYAGQRLNIAGNDILWSFGFALAYGGCAWYAADIQQKELLANPKGNSGKHLLPTFAAVGFGIASVICLIDVALEFKAAGNTLKKIHPIPGGVSVDLTRGRVK